MPAKLLLFDIDGTLLLSSGAGEHAMAEACRQLFGESFRFEVDTRGKLDPQIFAELSATNSHLDMQLHHDRFRERYLELLTAALTPEKVTVLPGVRNLLNLLRLKNQQTLGLLTGNYSRAAQLKFRAAGLEPSWFPITAFGDEAATRPGLVPVAKTKHERLMAEALAPHEIIVIGDTPRDIDCAKANGCIAFGVATGKFSFSDLQTAGADRVVETLSDPAPLLELL